MFKLFLTVSSLIMGVSISAFASDVNKITDLSAIYGIIAVVSLLLLGGYLLLVKKKDNWLTLLFTAIFVVNTGYWLLSVSGNLASALWANRISYLGSVFLPAAMYMLIARMCKTQVSKAKVIFAVSAGVLAFLIAASPGYSNIYYKSVSFEVVNGMAILKKIYGPLHFTYLVYLVGYFVSMIATIVYATVTKKISSNKFAVSLLSAVGVNIVVWFAEQIADFNFEFLSVSYIITEIFLLNMFMIFNDTSVTLEKTESVVSDLALQSDDAEKAKYILENLVHLTPTERRIYDLYCMGKNTSEVLEELGIKESTLKFHNSNIYGKLDVKSKKQLLSCVKYINSTQE